MRWLAMLFAVGFSEAAGQATPTIAPDQEIALALSAAPAGVARNAAVLVLGPRGFYQARNGSNGFTCLVERSQPGTSEPVCYDAEGSGSILPATLRRAELRAQGKNDATIAAEIRQGYSSGKFKAPARPGIAYMLSPDQTVFDPMSGKLVRYIPHVMFYAPNRRASELGMPADHAEAGLPFLIFEGEPEAMIIVPVNAGH